MVVWRKGGNVQEGNLLSDPSVAPTMNDLDGPTTVGSPWSIVITPTKAVVLSEAVNTSSLRKDTQYLKVILR